MCPKEIRQIGHRDKIGNGVTQIIVYLTVSQLTPQIERGVDNHTTVQNFELLFFENFLFTFIRSVRVYEKHWLHYRV